MSRYTGPQHYTAEQRAAYIALRAAHPDVYCAHGLWCGPDWEIVEAGMRAIAAQTTAESINEAFERWLAEREALAS